MLGMALIYLAAAIIAVPIAKHDQASLHKFAHLWGDNRNYGIAVKQHLDVLKEVLENDQKTNEPATTEVKDA